MTLSTYAWTNKPLDLNTGAFWKKNGYKVRKEAEVRAYLETRWGTSPLFAYRDCEATNTPEAGEKRRCSHQCWMKADYEP